MSHDPFLIKPNAPYHRRTMADDNFDQKTVMTLIPKQWPRRAVPKRRSWKVNQVLPIVKRGLANNATSAVYMLNMSLLPTDATPNQCLLWVEAFLESFEALNDRDEAAQVADNAINRSS